MEEFDKDLAIKKYESEITSLKQVRMAALVSSIMSLVGFVVALLYGVDDIFSVSVLSVVFIASPIVYVVASTFIEYKKNMIDFITVEDDD